MSTFYSGINTSSINSSYTLKIGDYSGGVNISSTLLTCTTGYIQSLKSDNTAIITLNASNVSITNLSVENGSMDRVYAKNIVTENGSVYANDYLNLIRMDENFNDLHINVSRVNLPGCHFFAPGSFINIASIPYLNTVSPAALTDNSERAANTSWVQAQKYGSLSTQQTWTALQNFSTITASTPVTGENTSRVATTEWVKLQNYGLGSASLSTQQTWTALQNFSTITASTPVTGENTSRVATTEWVKRQNYGAGSVSLGAQQTWTAIQNFSIITASTPVSGENTSRVATTEWVKLQNYGGGSVSLGAQQTWTAIQNFSIITASTPLNEDNTSRVATTNWIYKENFGKTYKEQEWTARQLFHSLYAFYPLHMDDGESVPNLQWIRDQKYASPQNDNRWTALQYFVRMQSDYPSYLDSGIVDPEGVPNIQWIFDQNYAKFSNTNAWTAIQNFSTITASTPQKEDNTSRVATTEWVKLQTYGAVDTNTSYYNTSDNTSSILFNASDINISALSVVCNSPFSARSFNSTSDERVKTNIQKLNNCSSLEIIRLLKPSKYDFVDSTVNQLGFIAQEIKEIPLLKPAIQEKGTAFIPNIYQSVTCENGWFITDFSLKRTDRIRYKKEGIYCIAQVISSEDGRYCLEDNYTGEIFIYGTEINDLHSVEKDMIFTIAVSALQRLDEIVSSQQKQIKDLYEKIECIQRV